MKLRLITSFVLIIISMVTFSEAQGISSLLMDRRYVEKQIGCILDRGYCDFLGKRMKGLLLEVLFNNCEQCSPQQSRQAYNLIQFMQQVYPNEWDVIMRFYRPPPPNTESSIQD